MGNLFGIGILVQIRDELTRQINTMTEAVERLEGEAERLTRRVQELEQQMNSMQSNINNSRRRMDDFGDSFNRNRGHMNRYEREMQRLSMLLGGEVPESTRQAYQEMFRLQQEVRRSTRGYGRFSSQALNARNRLNEFALGLDDTTFKHIFMRSQLGLTEVQLQQQANSIKLNARMTHLMGSQTQILTQRMQGLQRHGIKPEMLLPHSTIGMFQMLNETMHTSNMGINRLNAGYRRFGTAMEKHIKGWSAQKIAVKMAQGDMVKYGLILRGLTAGMANLTLAFPLVGAGALLAYGTMFKVAFSANEKLKDLADTTKNKLVKAFRPLIEVTSKFLEIAMKVVGKVADWVSAFNEAHPAIARVLAVIGFLAPAMTLLLLPVGLGIGLFRGWAVAINTAWTAVGGIITIIGTASATFLTFAGIIGAVVLVVGYLWKHCEGFRKAVMKVANVIKSVVINAFNSLKGAVKSVVDAFNRGGLAGALAQVETLFQNFVSNIATLAPQLIQKGAELIINLAKGISSHLPQIYAKASLIIKSLCDGIVANLPQILNSALTILQAYLNGLTTNIPMLLNAGVQIIMAIAQGIVQMLPTLIGTYTQIISMLTNTIATNLPMLLDCGIQILQMIVTGITNALPMIINSAIQIINQLISFITQNLPMLIQAGIDILTALVNAIVQNLPILIDACIQLLTALVNGIIQNLPMLLDCGVQIVTSLLGALIQNAPQLLQAGVNLILAVVNGIVQNLPQILNAGIQLVGQLLQCLISNAPRLISAGLQLIGQLALGLLQAVGQAVSSMGQVVGQAIQHIPSFFGQIASMGGQLISGLVKGILSGASAVVNAIGNVVGKAIDAGKKFLGIHSPSRVFRNQIGKYIPQGMAVGIKADMPKVEDAIMQMTTKPVKSAQEYIQSNSAMIGTPSTSTVNNNNKDTRANVTNNNRYEFNIVLDKDVTDPKLHARQIYEELKRLKELDESMKYDFDPASSF